MNILVVCTSAGRGGLELHARREARFLADDAAINCHLVAQENSCIAECVADGGVTPFYFSWRFKALPLLSAIKLARYIDDNEIDLVHFHWGAVLRAGETRHETHSGKINFYFTL